jgi:hypothetical protein
MAGFSACNDLIRDTFKVLTKLQVEGKWILMVLAVVCGWMQYAEINNLGWRPIIYILDASPGHNKLGY